jgi:arylsulfatase A-like enzyme
VVLRRVLCVAAGLGALASALDAQHSRPATRESKNVLVIVLDDLGTDKLEFYGLTPPTCSADPCTVPCVPAPTGCVARYPATPSLDRLRRQGVWFTRAYATPFCSSTRACIQTGRYGFRTGVGHLTNTLSVPGDYELPSSEKLLSELVREGFPANGPQFGRPYRCGAFGKWHLSTTRESDWGHAVENGYHRFYGTAGNVQNFFKYKRIEHDAGSPPIEETIDGRYTTPPYSTDTWHASVTSREAGEWIDAQNGPFLAYVAFSPPHLPLQVPPQELLSAETNCELGCAGLQPGDILDYQVDPVENLRLVYRAMVEAVDAEIGDLIDGMSEDKRNNTMIFVIGDNGTSQIVIDDPPHDPNHAKGYVYEWGIRVPLIVAGPLVKKPVSSEGWQSDALVSAVDLWRTIADITGADVDRVVEPGELDSLSFLPVLRDPTKPGKRSIVFSQLFLPNGVAPFPPPSCFTMNQRSTSNGTYKYIRTQTSVTGSPCGTPLYSEKLYHLPSDMEEAVNLLLSPLSPEASAALALLTAEMNGLSGL